MSTQSEVRDDDGNITHIREVSADGRVSELYEFDDSLASRLTGDYRGERIEIADHDEDGTTRAYEADNSTLAHLFGAERGEEKSEPQDSCCYITSACLDDLGIPRTSLEMKAMKVLTKNHILKSFSGKRDYIWYGKIAPKIVEAIRSQPNFMQTWKGVYENLRQVTTSVDSGNYQKGYDQYKSLVFGLEAQFVK